ncbi:ion transporter [Chitinispirillales bacterium ANBcel5]|uniref:ion transporter n=1 Tax=Cellulosispirillum alkaliphilum TaxID=3039283 RepID=UPI002A4FDCB8|nr:ion transporter [Chitinispirillales bacterium ANBcel5]
MSNNDVSKSINRRESLYKVIFESDTPLGRVFDIFIMVLIVLSTLTVMLESVQAFRARAPELFWILEWSFTLLFTAEYLLRIFSNKHPSNYIFSFFGIIDFLAIVPTYIELLAAGTGYLLVIRALRLLRIFRVLKLAEYRKESLYLKAALSASRRKISIFLFTVVLAMVLIGSTMYVVEGEEHGFVSIPTSIYWAIVTITTVGFGDITPQTSLGKMLASMAMLLGYSIIAVPTGIITAEMTRKIPSSDSSDQSKRCDGCAKETSGKGARYCKYCGKRL